MRQVELGEWADADGPLSLEDRRALLASPIGHGLHPRDLAVMVAEGYARLLTAAQGEILALAAQPQSDFYLVLAGTLEVARTDAAGGRHLLDRIGPGGACGAVTAFADHPRWPAAVHVIEDARLLAISTRVLLSDAAPTITRQRLLQNASRLLAERARHLHARGELLVRRGLRERLAFHLLRHADAAGRVPVTMTRQALADHLAVSRASMTRELGRMADEGLIAMSGRGFTVLDAAALARFAA